MKIKKPKFWDYSEPNFCALALWPFSFIFKIILFFKNGRKINYPTIKTVCLGNIYVGGTGKTSLAIEIKKIFDDKNIKSCFIKKAYLNQIDEIRLLEKYGKTIVKKKRSDALKQAISEKYEVAIFDDGLQDNSINYDLSFVCFNKLNWIGNGFLIPAGPLREDIMKLTTYKNIFLNGNNENIIDIKTKLKKINPHLNIYDSEYKIINDQDFSRNLKYLAFSGIGNHQTYINMLKNKGFNIVHDIEYPDHYSYSNQDLKDIKSLSKNLNTEIITTEKDFLRLNMSQNKDIKFIKTVLELSSKDKFINQLLS